MVLTEVEMLELIKRSKKVIIYETKAPSKYIPLGLAKIASYAQICGNQVVYQKGDYVPCGEDLLCTTTVFTYDFLQMQKDLYEIKQVDSLLGIERPILVGGVAPSIMPDTFIDGMPDDTLFYFGQSEKLDTLHPNHSINYNKGEWEKYYTLYTTRGCPNRCGYCIVHKLEHPARINPFWKILLQDIDKPKIMISDNNLTSFPPEHYREVLKELAKTRKKILFNNGLDIKYLNEESCKLLGDLRYDSCGLRISFDRIEEEEVYRESLERLLKYVSKGNIMSFTIFNFKDTPAEAVYRAMTAAKFGVTPYPNVYRPINSIEPKSSYIGKYWTKGLVRCFVEFFRLRTNYTKYDFFDWVGKQDKIKNDWGNIEEYRYWFNYKPKGV